MLFYMSTPLRMHYRIHVTKNNELFCHVTRPSKPSRYINYGLTHQANTTVTEENFGNDNKVIS